ncbi:DUF4376 domain-containing protein [Roseomonas sp. HJA6]|uniref:DUF4376 domain-containing protein n=1 Tax=Roseomonas alba TaxID=2846776 RepID=A0ABS7AI97_9PROT|nr:DUF4376 domain-containing protein [Neoroseomonas alba]MBW6402022.1 DUF4376 domain-containing protein [Neoroseomonas alba]
MKTYARISAGIVAELIRIPSDGPEVEKLFHPDLVATMQALPEGSDVAEGWSWDGMAFAPPAPPALAVAQAARKAAARQGLDARIAAGMPYGGATLQIDETSQARISAAVLLAQYELPAGFAWRMADNSAVPIDAAGMIAMGRQAAEYVAALRAHYWGLADAIAAAPDAAALDAIDLAAGWPAPAEG